MGRCVEEVELERVEEVVPIKVKSVGRDREREREIERERELTTCLGVGGEEEWHQVLIRSVHVDFGSEVVNSSRSCPHVDGTRALIRGPAYINTYCLLSLVHGDCFTVYKKETLVNKIRKILKLFYYLKFKT